MRLAFKKVYPDYFSTDYTPKTLEAVSNRRETQMILTHFTRGFDRVLEGSKRILKPGGILSLRFITVRTAPGLMCSRAYLMLILLKQPIRLEDETKGEEQNPTFGSQTIE